MNSFILKLLSLIFGGKIRVGAIYCVVSSTGLPGKDFQRTFHFLDILCPWRFLVKESPKIKIYLFGLAYLFSLVFWLRRSSSFLLFWFKSPPVISILCLFHMILWWRCVGLFFSECIQQLYLHALVSAQSGGSCVPSVKFWFGSPCFLSHLQIKIYKDVRDLQCVYQVGLFFMLVVSNLFLQQNICPLKLIWSFLWSLCNWIRTMQLAVDSYRQSTL